jgi:hypothetical protein
MLLAIRISFEFHAADFGFKIMHRRVERPQESPIPSPAQRSSKPKVYKINKVPLFSPALGIAKQG